MCRIAVGVAKSTIEYTTPFLVDSLLDACLQMSDRSNRDGTGVYLTNAGVDGYTRTWFKRARPCSEFVLMPEFKSWLTNNYSGSGPVICHVRQATTGKGNWTEDANAHPFVLDNLALVHNGHLLNADDIRDSMGLDKRLTVDSEIWLHALRKISDGKPLDIPIIQETVDHFIGPFVFVVHEIDQDFVWLIIGKSRTLFRYDSPDYSVVLTEAGNTGLLTRAFGRYSFLEGIPDTDFRTGEKLLQDTVYKLSERGIEVVGNIHSVEEYPKVKALPRVSTVQSATRTGATQSANTTSIVTCPSTINLTEVRSDIAARDSFLDAYNLGSVDLEMLLEQLSPVFPDSMYELTVDDLVFLTGFFEHLGVKLEHSQEKLHLWNIFKQVIGFKPLSEAESVPYGEAKTLAKNFLCPYMLNPLQTLHNLVEAAKMAGEVHDFAAARKEVTNGTPVG